ncbi:unnamed protein product [Ixodes persulcatus]
MHPTTKILMQLDLWRTRLASGRYTCKPSSFGGRFSDASKDICLSETDLSAIRGSRRPILDVASDPTSRKTKTTSVERACIAPRGPLPSSIPRTNFVAETTSEQAENIL